MSSGRWWSLSFKLEIHQLRCRKVHLYKRSPVAMYLYIPIHQAFFLSIACNWLFELHQRFFFHPYENSLDAIDVLYFLGLKCTCIIMHGGFWRAFEQELATGFSKSLNLNLLYVPLLAYETYLKKLTPLRQIFLFTNIIHVG